jgi:hypothetical protein
LITPVVKSRRKKRLGKPHWKKIGRGNPVGKSRGGSLVEEAQLEIPVSRGLVGKYGQTKSGWVNLFGETRLGKFSRRITTGEIRLKK